MLTYLQRLPEALKDQLRDSSALVGDRRPTKYPTWVTLEVAAGGFATGRASARNQPGEETSAAFLERGGLDTLTDLLASGHYTIEHPENAALLTVAWLMKEPRREAEAAAVLEAVAPYLEELRLHPYPSTCPPTLSDRTGALFTVRQLEGKLLAYQNAVKSAEKHGATRWVRNTRQAAVAHHYAPLQAAMAACLAGTIQDMPAFLGGDDAQLFAQPADAACAQSLVDRCEALRAQFPNNAVPNHQAVTSTTEILLAALKAIAASQAVAPAALPALAARLRGTLRKRGLPGSAALSAYLERTRRSACETAHTRVEKVDLLTHRLQQYAKDNFLPANATVDAKVGADESAAIAASLHPELAPSLLQLVRRSLDRTLEAHVQSGAIVSAEMIAEVVPHLFASAIAGCIKDPSARQLYALVAKAFARRRSLLLYNQQQVRMEELPWVQPLSALVQGQHVAAPVEATVRDVVLCYLKHFPATIIPNKLVSALKDVTTKGAHRVPLTEELATDIFCGSFSQNFTNAAVLASREMRHTIYAKYYGLDNLYATMEAQCNDYLERLRAHYVSHGFDRYITNGEFLDETIDKRAALLASLGVTDLAALRNSDDGGSLQTPPLSHEQANAALIAISAFENERSKAHQDLYRTQTSMHEPDALAASAKRLIENWGTPPAKNRNTWRSTVDNGRTIEAAMVITTHNLAQLAARGSADAAAADDETAAAMAQFDFAAAALDVWRTMLRTLQNVPSGRMQMLHAQRDLAYMWRQLLFFASKHSPVAADIRAAVVEPMREAAIKATGTFPRTAPPLAEAQQEDAPVADVTNSCRGNNNIMEFLERFYIQPLERCAVAVETGTKETSPTPAPASTSADEQTTAPAAQQRRCLTDDGTVIMGYFGWNPYVAAGLTGSSAADQPQPTVAGSDDDDDDREDEGDEYDEDNVADNNGENWAAEN